MLLGVQKQSNGVVLGLLAIIIPATPKDETRDFDSMLVLVFVTLTRIVVCIFSSIVAQGSWLMAKKEQIGVRGPGPRGTLRALKCLL